MAAPTGFAKAYLIIEDGEKIDCWFNPTDYSISRSNQWNVEPVIGSDEAKVEFTGGGQVQLQLSLMFDDSEAEGGDVRKITDPLFAAMEADKKFADGKNSGRPPKIEFGWGSTTTFKAVCTQLSVNFTLFESNGAPIRAEATMTLLQVEKPTRRGSGSRNQPQNPTTRGIAGIRSHVVVDGDSLQTVAHRAYGDATRWRTIAEANGIDDPMALRRGMVLSIPLVRD